MNKTLNILLSCAVSASLAAAAWHARTLIAHEARMAVVERRIDKLDEERKEIQSLLLEIHKLVSSIDIRLAVHESETKRIAKP